MQVSMDGHPVFGRQLVNQCVGARPVSLCIPPKGRKRSGQPDIRDFIFNRPCELLDVHPILYKDLQFYQPTVPRKPKHRDADLKINCKALLFDMDGTLVDSTPVVERGWSWWAQRHQLSLKEVLLFSHGRPTAATLEHFLPGVDHTAELKEMLAFEETELSGVVPIPGAEAVLRAVGQRPWAVVTSAPRNLAVTRIRAAGLPLPGVLIPADEIQQAKPEPEGYLLAAERLGIHPKDCVVFEDTVPGIQAGLSAGMRVVGLLTTTTARYLKHEPLIKNFLDVQVTTLATGFEITLV